MPTPLPRPVRDSVYEQDATRDELDAAILAFNAAAKRNCPGSMVTATSNAHDALQAHLDAVSSGRALFRRHYG